MRANHLFEWEIEDEKSEVRKTYEVEVSFAPETPPFTKGHPDYWQDGTGAEVEVLFVYDRQGLINEANWKDHGFGPDEIKRIVEWVIDNPPEAPEPEYENDD